MDRALLVPNGNSPVAGGSHHHPLNNRLTANALYLLMCYHPLCKKKTGNRNGFLFLYGFLRRLLLGVFLLELLHPSLGIKNLLFAGKERVTL
jgi:hypothetical protein